MAFHNSGRIVTNGLVLSLDAADRNSYVSGSTTWFDLSGNNNTGSLVNGPTFNSANGGAIAFNGVNTRVNFGTILNYTSDSFSFCFSFYLTSLTTNLINQGPIIFYKGRFSEYGYYCQIDQTSKSIYFVTNQGGAYQSTATFSDSFSTGSNYHVGITRSSSTVRIYINGIDSTSSAGTHVNPATSAANFTLATYDTSIYANIRLYNFMSYNRALSAQEVKQNYDAMKSRFNLT